MVVRLSPAIVAARANLDIVVFHDAAEFLRDVAAAMVVALLGGILKKSLRIARRLVAEAQTRGSGGPEYPWGMLTLPDVPEPVDIKNEYNRLPSNVREAAMRQSSDFSKLVYRGWKDQLKQAGLTWQKFLADASMNRTAWRGWLDGELSWGEALEALVQRLNQQASDPLAFG